MKLAIVREKGARHWYGEAVYLSEIVCERRDAKKRETLKYHCISERKRTEEEIVRGKERVRRLEEEIVRGKMLPVANR